MLFQFVEHDGTKFRRVQKNCKSVDEAIKVTKSIQSPGKALTNGKPSFYRGEDAINLADELVEELNSKLVATVKQASETPGSVLIRYCKSCKEMFFITHENCKVCVEEEKNPFSICYKCVQNRRNGGN